MKTTYLFFIATLLSINAFAQTANRFKDSQTIDEFFHYHADRKRPLILAHRGGPGALDTENSIPTFEKTARKLPDAILEMDVRLTRDSGYVMLHDPTLDRESDATGAVAEWMTADLKKVRLKTLSGRQTDQPIPTFAQVLAWNNNRYVLALDIKPGTDPIRAMNVVLQHKAEHAVFVICYSLADAQRMRNRFPSLWLAVGVSGPDDVDRLENSSLPASRLIALTPQKLQPKSFYERLHSKGILCAVGTYGPQQLDEKPLSEAKAGYWEIVRQGGDIITTDRPEDVSSLF